MDKIFNNPNDIEKDKDKNKKLNQRFNSNFHEIQNHIHRITSINDIANRSNVDEERADILINTDLSKNYIRNYRTSEDYSTFKSQNQPNENNDNLNS